jgi:hypothetical protein
MFDTACTVRAWGGGGGSLTPHANLNLGTTSKSENTLQNGFTMQKTACSVDTLHARCMRSPWHCMHDAWGVHDTACTMHEESMTLHARCMRSPWHCMHDAWGVHGTACTMHEGPMTLHTWCMVCHWRRMHNGIMICVALPGNIFQNYSYKQIVPHPPTHYKNIYSKLCVCGVLNWHHMKAWLFYIFTNSKQNSKRNPWIRALRGDFWW